MIQVEDAHPSGEEGGQEANTKEISEVREDVCEGGEARSENQDGGDEQVEAEEVEDEAEDYQEDGKEEQNWKADYDNDDEEQEEEEDEEEEYDGKDYDWSTRSHRKRRRESEEKVPTLRSTFMSNSNRDLLPRESGKERVRGLMRYSGPLQNPLLKSRNFHWPEYRDQKLRDMAQEGWITDPKKNALIGTSIRRFFIGVGKADGVIVGQLPASLNDGHSHWHIVHDDGDSEDLSDDDTLLCRQMFLRNDSLPRIPPNRIEFLFRGKNSGPADMTFPLYRKSCQIGADYQVQELPNCTGPEPELPIDPTVSPEDPSDLSSVPLPVLELSPALAAASESSWDSVITASPDFQDFQRQAIAILLTPGMVTRYLASSPPCQSEDPFLHYLDLVCCVSAVPTESLSSCPSRYVVFDGTQYHTCHAKDLAQPFSDSIHLPSLFLENELDIQRSLASLRTELQRLLSAEFTPQQLLILQTFLSSWSKYGSDIRTSFQRSSSLRSLITYRDMVRLYYRFLPFLSRNEENGAAVERTQSLYDLSFALRGISCECPQKEQDQAQQEEEEPSLKKTHPWKRQVGTEEGGDWGGEGDLCDVFFPQGTASKSSSRRSESRRRSQQGSSSRDLRSSNGLPPQRKRHRAAAAGAGTGGGVNYPVREVQVVDEATGEVVSEYSTITEASSSTGVAPSVIWKSCIAAAVGADASSTAAAGGAGEGLKWRFTDQEDIPSLVDEFDERSDEEYQYPSIFERTGPKQVEQLDALTGEVLHIYPSGVSAGRAVGIGQKAISDCCHGRRQTSGGFKWRFHQISPGDETQSFIGGGGAGGSKKLQGQGYGGGGGGSALLTGPKPVEQIDLKTGEVLRVFETGADAARTFSISPNAISACCHGRRFSAAGFQWRFVHRDPVEATPRPANQHRKSLEESSQQVAQKTTAATTSVGATPVGAAVASVGGSVEQVDIATGAVLRVYPSIFEAARSLGVSSHVILACCSGRRQYAGGYSWRYQRLAPSSASSAGAGDAVDPTAAPMNGFPLRPSLSSSSAHMMRPLPLDSRRVIPTPMIQQVDLVTEAVVKEHTTVSEAARAARLPINSITLCCLGRLNSAGGYRWRFKKTTDQPPFAHSHPLPERRGPLTHALLVDTPPPLPVTSHSPAPLPAVDPTSAAVAVTAPTPPPATGQPALASDPPQQQALGKEDEPRDETTEATETTMISSEGDTATPLPISEPTTISTAAAAPLPPSPVADLSAPSLLRSFTPLLQIHTAGARAIRPLPAGSTLHSLHAVAPTIPTSPSPSPSTSPVSAPPHPPSVSTLPSAPRASLSGPAQAAGATATAGAEATAGAQEAAAARHSSSGCGIEQVDPVTGVVIAAHPSFRAAGKLLGITPRAISHCVSGKRQLAGGFLWRYRLPSAPLPLTRPITSAPHPIPIGTEDEAPSKIESTEATGSPEKSPATKEEEPVAAPEEEGDGTNRSSRKRKSTVDHRLYEYTPPAARAPPLPRRTAEAPRVHSSSSRPSNRPQPVQQVDLATGTVIATFTSKADAVRSTGVCSTTISQCCSGSKVSVGGYGWRYCDLPPSSDLEEQPVEKEEGNGEVEKGSGRQESDDLLDMAVVEEEESEGHVPGAD